MAVRFIEPSAVVAVSKPSAAVPPRENPFRSLFPPGSWELERPKILETEQGTLLFGDCRPMDDPRMIQLDHCTLVRHVATAPPPPDRRAVSQDPHGGRPVVLQAPAGAVLVFDQPLDVSRGEFGNLTTARLFGEVVIFSPATDAKSNDALRISTRNVQIDARRIWTPERVDFRYGPNGGHGRDLAIEWSRTGSKAGEGGGRRAPFGNLQSLELVHLDQLVLHLEDFGSLAAACGQNPRPAAARESPRNAGAAAEPVEVSCKGPLRVQFAQQIASLREQVRLFRPQPGGAGDELTCEILELHFGEEPATAGERPPSRGGSSLPPLKPRKIVALGRPARIRAASLGAEARAERMEYDFLRRRARMEDQDRVFLRDPRHRAEVREWEYEMGPPGRLGQMWARGPGQVWGKTDKWGRDFEAAWRDEAFLRPHAQDLVLSLIGDARVLARPMGEFASEQIHLFLYEIREPGQPERYRPVIDRMKAVGHVRLDSPRFCASVKEANLWFREAPPPQAAPAKPGAPRAPAAGPPSPKPNPDETTPGRRYDLTADLLQAQVVLSDPPQVERVTLQGGIRLQGTSSRDSQPAELFGELFELREAGTGQADGVLMGRPACVALRGAQIASTQFRVRQRENSLESPGAGSMTIPQQRDGRLAEDPPLVVRWEGGMRFDGLTADFQRQVSLRVEYRLQDGDRLRSLARGESLRIALTHHVDFANPRVPRSLDVRHMTFPGGVFVESRLLDPRGDQKAFQQMSARNLAVEHTTGLVQADGPGWVSAVIARGAPPDAPSRPNPASSSAVAFDYLRVHFERQMVGHLPRREMEFLDRIRAVYGPVSSWEGTLEESQPPAMGEESILLTCQRLAVADMGSSAAELKALELEATGNAVVTGRSFTATGQRISYARAKDLLVLEGDGRNDAVLSGVTAAELKAGRILFWPGTRQFQLNAWRSLDLRDLGQLRALREAAPRPLPATDQQR